jgi:hypothetical protein
MIEEGKHERIINFGAAGYEDFTTHKDSDRRDFYISRHKTSEEKFWGHNKELTPAYLSRWILWEKPSLDEAIRFVEKQRGIKITKKL